MGSEDVPWHEAGWVKWEQYVPDRERKTLEEKEILSLWLAEYLELFRVMAANRRAREAER
jgi:hypothetical protein